VTDAEVIARLKPWAARLAEAASRQPPVPFVPRTWCAWLQKAGDERLKAVSDRAETLMAWIGVSDPTIPRRHLRHLAAADSPDADLRLLVATLSWGRGKRNGRMLPRMVETLKAADRNDVLSRTASAAAEGRIVDAYRAWTLPGLREPFFTKWLWSAGTRSTSPAAAPLVLDGRVWRSLNRGLTWDSIIAAQSWERACRYEAYCEAMVRWATGLSGSIRVSAEDVEYGLFYANGDLDNLGELP
jgi:hypothetical protein